MPKVDNIYAITDEARKRLTATGVIEGGEFTRKVRVPTSDLAPHDKYEYTQRRNKLARRGAIVAGALLALSSLVFERPVDVLGDRSERIARTEQIEIAHNRAERILSSGSAIEKFTRQYIEPDYIIVEGERGGSFIADINLFEERFDARPELGVYVGQNCLAGSGFDTSPSSIRGRRIAGEISAPATLEILENNKVAIHAAGSGAVTLIFENPNDGPLKPSEATSRTLVGMNCNLKEILYENTGTDYYPDYKPLES